MIHHPPATEEKNPGAAEVIRDPTPPLNAVVRVTPPANVG
jgi:hypothetical protein